MLTNSNTRPYVPRKKSISAPLLHDVNGATVVDENHYPNEGLTSDIFDVEHTLQSGERLKQFQPTPSETVNGVDRMTSDFAEIVKTHNDKNK